MSSTLFLLGREDISDVASLEKTSFPTAWTEDHFSIFLRHPRIPLDKVPCVKALPDLVIFGIREDNALAAYCTFRLTRVVDEAELYNIAVQPALQGRGYGKRLLTGALAFLEGVPVFTAVLEVRPTNIAAITLYRNCGFVECGIRKRYYGDGEDALIMRK